MDVSAVTGDALMGFAVPVAATFTATARVVWVVGIREEETKAAILSVQFTEDALTQTGMTLPTVQYAIIFSKLMRAAGASPLPVGTHTVPHMTGISIDMHV
jgi:hypothetical protein